MICALLGVTSGSASAAAEVRGQADNVQLRAQDATTREVLDALSAAFKLTYRLPTNIGRDLTGLYSGTLHQVLARILDGNDYVVKVSDNGIEVVVLGASSTTAIAASGQAAVASVQPIAPSGPAISRSENTPPAGPPISSTATLAASGAILPSSVPPAPLATYLPAN